MSVTHQPNPRFPHTCVISRMSDDGDPMTDETEKTIIYQGKCRSFDHHTTSDSGDVLISNRKLSLPVKQSEWGTEQYPIPREGDVVEVQKYGYSEYGIVKDIMPSNLGTHLLWKYERD